MYALQDMIRMAEGKRTEGIPSKACPLLCRTRRFEEDFLSKALILANMTGSIFYGKGDEGLLSFFSQADRKEAALCVTEDAADGGIIASVGMGLGFHGCVVCLPFPHRSDCVVTSFGNHGADTQYRRRSDVALDDSTRGTLAFFSGIFVYASGRYACFLDAVDAVRRIVK